MSLCGHGVLTPWPPSTWWSSSAQAHHPPCSIPAVIKKQVVLAASFLHIWSQTVTLTACGSINFTPSWWHIPIICDNCLTAWTSPRVVLTCTYNKLIAGKIMHFEKEASWWYESYLCELAMLIYLPVSQWLQNVAVHGPNCRLMILEVNSSFEHWQHACCTDWYTDSEHQLHMKRSTVVWEYCMVIVNTSRYKV